MLACAASAIWAAAIVVYVLVLQVGLIVTYHIAAAHAGVRNHRHATHRQLLSCPTASWGHDPHGADAAPVAQRRRQRQPRRALTTCPGDTTDDGGTGPVVVYMTFSARDRPHRLRHRRVRAEVGRPARIGAGLGQAFTLIPYAMTLVQLRVFYAREDAWTPTAMVIGITVVKVGAFGSGPVRRPGPHHPLARTVQRPGLPGGRHRRHYHLRSHLGNERMPAVARTTVVTIAASVCRDHGDLGLACGRRRRPSGGEELGRIGWFAYLCITAVVGLGLAYAIMAAAKVPDIVAITSMIRRAIGRFVPPRAGAAARRRCDRTTVAFQGLAITNRSLTLVKSRSCGASIGGTATWQSYTVHSGGAAGTGSFPYQPRGADGLARPDMRYRRRGVPLMSDEGTGPNAEPGSTGPATTPEAADDSAAPTTAADDQAAETAGTAAPESAPGKSGDAAGTSSAVAEPIPDTQRPRGPPSGPRCSSCRRSLPPHRPLR